MKDVKDCWAIQIELTNKCENKCSNCTHCVPHFKEHFVMPIDTVKKAVESLEGFRGLIGFIGGNPSILPLEYIMDVVDILDNYKVSFAQRGWWTSNFFGKEDFIRANFGYINYNTHKDDVIHSPVFMACSEIITDIDELAKTIDNCWLADLWSPSITPQGVYRCEVAGAFDMVLKKGLGLPIEKGWYNRPLSDFDKQIAELCTRCGVCMSLRGRSDKEEIDDFTPFLLEEFRDAGSPRINKGEYEIKKEADKDKEPHRYITKTRCDK